MVTRDGAVVKAFGVELTLPAGAQQLDLARQASSYPPQAGIALS